MHEAPGSISFFREWNQQRMKLRLRNWSPENLSHKKIAEEECDK